MLIILDGVGLGESEDNSGLSLANTPNLDVLLNDYPMSKIDASGNSVGLPEGQMGNSEVGHLTIGKGSQIAAKTGVTKDLPPGQKWAGWPVKRMDLWKKELIALKKIIKK